MMMEARPAAALIVTEADFLQLCPCLDIGIAGIEIKFAGHRNGQFRQLTAAGRLVDIDGNTAEHRSNFNSRCFDLFQESAGERAVAAGAVSRDLIGLRGKGYDHAAWRFNSRKTACLDKIALHAARTEALRKRIVAACVQDQ